MATASTDKTTTLRAELEASLRAFLAGRGVDTLPDPPTGGTVTRIARRPVGTRPRS
jgi:hypothetical protein